MIITENLKTWLIEHCGVKEDVTDDELQKAVGQAFADDKLTVEKYGELTKSPEEDKANEFSTQLKQVADGLTKLTKRLDAGSQESDTNESKETKPADKAIGGVSTAIANAGVESDDKGGNIRVKEAVEAYSDTKSALHYPSVTKKNTPHAFAGKQVELFGRGLDEASDRDKALAGAWAKFQILSATPKLAGSVSRAWEMLSDHEKGLMGYLVSDKCNWDASTDKHDRITKGYSGGLKTLFDDATSGGLEAAPIVFDDQVISIPLLFGELFPLVTQVPLDRGRRVEGVATGNVTGTWGGVDDTAITLFSTTGYVTAFNTTIHRWQGAVTIGLDFVTDTPINFGAHITQQYGNRLQEDLDDAIAVGNGTTQPQGITNSGATAVSWGSATSLGNYESLRFAVALAEHNGPGAGNPVFCGNETSYQRALSIPVGASDARRVFGTAGYMPDYDRYNILQRPYKINESLSNLQIWYAIMSKYRMYRRKGFAIRTSTEGDTLIRDNNMLISVTARYGGQIERGAVAALVTDAPT